MRKFLLVFAVVLASILVSAQAAPIKMGLWEKTMVTTGGPGGPSTLKAKSCMTPQTWEQAVASASKPHEGCTQNMQKTAHGYSYDVSCTGKHLSLVSQGTTTIQDSEHIVSDSHTTSTMATGEKRVTDMHSTSRFLSSDCGKVTPGDPEIEDQ